VDKPPQRVPDDDCCEGDALDADHYSPNLFVEGR
jgi:hypothetical protein